MRDTERQNLAVQQISPRAWEEMAIKPIGEPLPLDAWLRMIREDRMGVVTQPYSRIQGGAYDGGHVIAVDTDEGRHFFMVPAAAIPLLREFLDEEDYRELARRTPKLAASSGMR